MMRIIQGLVNEIARYRYVKFRGDKNLHRCRKILAWWPGHYNSLMGLARAHLGRGEYETAWTLLRRAAKSKSDYPEPYAHLARLALQADRREEAERYARQSIAYSRTYPQPFDSKQHMQSIIAHAQSACTTLENRHVAICGVSFCGSTLLSYLLGSIDGVGNVGESHWLIHYRDAGKLTEVDYAREDCERVAIRCACCGSNCACFTTEFRRRLSADRVDWYQKIAVALQERILVSADKNHTKLLVLDPMLRFDAVVLFKTPTAAWNSAVAKPKNTLNVEQYLVLWEQEYRRLAFDMPNRGEKIFMNFELFRRDVPHHLERLCNLLQIPFPGPALEVKKEQHAIGGNRNVKQAVHRTPGIRSTGDVYALDQAFMMAADRKKTAAYEQNSSVFRFLQSEHERQFGTSLTD